MFLDLANASAHTNYLIQIVKEHFVSQKKSPIKITIDDNNSVKQRSESLTVISTIRQALLNISFSFLCSGNQNNVTK
jgi:hypothetical protein